MELGTLGLGLGLGLGSGLWVGALGMWIGLHVGLGARGLELGASVGAWSGGLGFGWGLRIRLQGTLGLALYFMFWAQSEVCVLVWLRQFSLCAMYFVLCATCYTI